MDEDLKVDPHVELGLQSLTPLLLRIKKENFIWGQYYIQLVALTRTLALA